MSPLPDEALAREVIATALAMEDRGINNAMSGNVSVRVGEADAWSMLITPSSVPYDQLQPDQLVLMQPDGQWKADKGLRPSSEWQFHLDILRARDDVGAVVHAHPINATALACHGRPIEAFHYMVGVAGGTDIRCADYATFGSPELSTNVVQALDGRKACLMSNHGLVAVGPTARAALDLAVEVEVLASQYLAALAIGEPRLLSESQMDEVLDKMSQGAGYGSS